MNPGELISFFNIGFAGVIAIIILWFIFRKRRKLVIALTSMLVLGYIGYFLYYPTLKINTHTKGYGIVIEYLDMNYPDKEFTISPQHYEAGYTVGDFQVNDIETPTIGVTLRVDKEKKVMQIGTWSNLEYPTQQELWREIESIYGEANTLDKDIAEISKKDEWFDGELTAFALTIDDLPAIALFNYSKAGYSLLELREEDFEDYVIIEKEGYVFI
ncbi:hypothetical protein [Sporosarcina sp. FA9]|uniref:hypothetical protein n=1 Tax=Sporosarcina sp. FA9 TaxID=3413030 RepID=UPI003F65FB12